MFAGIFHTGIYQNRQGNSKKATRYPGGLYHSAITLLVLPLALAYFRENAC